MAQLPSTASVKDIISALQTMECINQKADLASVVGSPAVSTDDVATIITKLQNAKNTLASNLNAQGQTASPTESLSSLVGKVTASPMKKWASGTTSTSASSSILTVSGLAFKPSYIIIEHYLSGKWYRKVFDSDRSTSLLNGAVVYTDESAGVSAIYQYGFTITSNGFSTDALNKGTAMNWIAFE